MFNRNIHFHCLAQQVKGIVIGLLFIIGNCHIHNITRHNEAVRLKAIKHYTSPHINNKTFTISSK